MRKTRGFTLVELLVVIGIIALLISILLPSLANARRNANSIKCLSNLRQIATCYTMYAGEYKGAIPVVRQDYPDLTPATTRYYWWDMITPYLARLNKITTAQNTSEMDEARRTIIWGCTEWDGRMDLSYGTASFYPGYAMNLHPYFMPGSTTVQKNLTACRWQGVYFGQYYKMSSVRNPAERVMIADAQLWILDARESKGGGVAALPGQPIDVTANNAGKTGQAGLMDYDLYRHGKHPPATGAFYKGGKLAFNAAYFDGHAEAINDISKAYHGIFLQDPP
jgi:prepilin-type N-terminal cleavage/methylation domain-containing protein/prepilin-type processing-associated H-X9-DG protein